MATDYSYILLEKYADKQWAMHGDDYSGLDWQDSSAKPSKETLDSEYTAHKTKYAYKEKRREEYPSFEDQFDKIYHDGIDSWKAQIKAIKDKYPK